MADFRCCSSCPLCSLHRYVCRSRSDSTGAPRWANADRLCGVPALCGRAIQRCFPAADQGIVGSRDGRPHAADRDADSSVRGGNLRRVCALCCARVGLRCCRPPWRSGCSAAGLVLARCWRPAAIVLSGVSTWPSPCRQHSPWLPSGSCWRAPARSGMGLSTALLQQLTHDRILGRVMALDFGDVMLTMSVSTLLYGRACDVIGPRHAGVAGALILVTLGLLWLGVFADGGASRTTRLPGTWRTIQIERASRSVERKRTKSIGSGHAEPFDARRRAPRYVDTHGAGRKPFHVFLRFFGV